MLTQEESEELACDWADFRKEVGVPSADISMGYKAFRAGWIAGRHGEQSSVQR